MSRSFFHTAGIEDGIRPIDEEMEGMREGECFQEGMREGECFQEGDERGRVFPMSITELSRL